jgi:hypothetical protein
VILEYFLVNFKSENIQLHPSLNLILLASYDSICLLVLLYYPKRRYLKVQEKFLSNNEVPLSSRGY